jgi:hypothetical protein
MAATGHGRNEPVLRPVELYQLSGAPELDEDAAEWKVSGIAVRMLWGLVSGSGWVGGGHRSEGMVERRWRKKDSGYESTLWLPDWWRKAGDSQEALEAPPPLYSGERVYVATIDSTLHVVTNYKDRLVGFCLAEDHQGYKAETDVYVGTWDGSEWSYECGSDKIYTMVDNRYGMPYPDEGSTGLGQWRENSVIELVSLDCDTPGSCC